MAFRRQLPDHRQQFRNRDRQPEDVPKRVAWPHTPEPENHPALWDFEEPRCKF